ncbi:hypothetical protein FRB94_011203 [Tulasnella sp. JGI-2019a]|nr:hypothetical protein FRB94_011203 [Tulasnella sp. JGI-2019a]KAG9000733.1 hypothetical protein FRB93_012559 [Tulasnella sp. JGI-2019a]
MAFCANPEGWGPISKHRQFDLTPCFENGVLLGGILTLVFLGSSLRTFQLRKTHIRHENVKTRKWLGAKMVVYSLVTVLSFIIDARAVMASVSPLKDQATYVGALQIGAFPAAALLTRSNHTKTRRSSTLLSLLWPLYIIAQLITLRTFYEVNDGNYKDIWFILTSVLTGLVAIVFVLELKGPEPEAALGDRESPYVVANFYSRIFFHWMTPLMTTGASRFITEKDMYELLPDDESKVLGERLQNYWDRQKNKNSWALWRALAHAYGGTFALAGLLKIMQDILAFAQPQLLRLLLSYITSYQGNSQSTPFEGMALAGIMFVAALSQTAILHQYFYLCFLTGMRVRAGLVTTVYKKALVISNDSTGSRGETVNLMSLDATRMQDLCAYGLIFLSGPFQITLAFISLYRLLGWPSFVGVAIMAISIPLQSLMARYLKNLQSKQMKIRDERTKLMSELLSNIKSIKLYSWEEAFKKMVGTVRNAELQKLKTIGVTTALNMALWSAIPLLVSFATFAVTAYASSKELTAEIIFPAIALFNLLGFPLAMFAQIVSSWVQASVSVNRLAGFLSSAELQPDAVQITDDTDLSPGDTVLSIRQGSFKWLGKTAEPTLEDINMTVRKGELVGVMGRVGAGKSSLLSAVIGEMTKLEGEVSLRGRTAYAPQNPWIMSSSVRDNITFFRKFDQAYYDLVLDACALRQDLALLADGDLTEVGEKGITLSGGQKARVSLARAVYARADLYLLDDVLAALDAHVGRHVFDHVIGPHGLLATKARVHVTNSVTFASQHDQLHFMRRGIFLESGSYGDIMGKPGSELFKLVTGVTSLASRSGSGTVTPNANSERTAIDIDDSEMAFDGSNEDMKKVARRKSQRAPSLLSPEAQKALTDQSLATQSKVVQKERSEQGKVKREVYWQYLQAASFIGAVAYVFAIILAQGFNVLSTWILKIWGENNRSSHPRSHSFFLSWYGAFIFASALAAVASGILLWVTLAVRSGRRLHDRMLNAVLRAPLQFFESTPQGRIMNLFSRDQYVVDEVMVRVLAGFTRTLAVVAGIFIVIVGSFPIAVIGIIPLAYIYKEIMIYYLATSREIKRLDAVSKSPIFAWFQESLGGLSTIRAYRLQSTFIVTNEIRLDANQRCYMPSTNVNRWLAVRLELLGGIIVLLTTILSMIALFTSGRVDAGLVGFVLSYALNTTQALNWVVRQAGEVEQNIVSVERIMTYIDLEPEAAYEIPESKPAESWPSKGEIEFKDYSMRYRPDLDPCLVDLNLKIRGGERIGICGRTGAGKSSSTLALLRILEASAGSINIDGVDISKIGLHDLRSAISIIPQEPQLFEGSIRQNVDPTGSYEDVDIWTALEQSHLKEYVLSLPGGLDGEVREGGSSLSSGQRQLLCFARALLRKSKILILDEATSAVDLQTDEAIQDIIRGPVFQGVTMLTIAHRLNTIVGSDRILVLDCGAVAEFDTPSALMANPNTKFYSLAQEAGVLTPPQSKSAE